MAEADTTPNYTLLRLEKEEYDEFVRKVVEARAKSFTSQPFPGSASDAKELEVCWQSGDIVGLSNILNKDPSMISIYQDGVFKMCTGYVICSPFTTHVDIYMFNKFTEYILNYRADQGSQYLLLAYMSRLGTPIVSQKWIQIAEMCHRNTYPDWLYELVTQDVRLIIERHEFIYKRVIFYFNYKHELQLLIERKLPTITDFDKELEEVTSTKDKLTHLKAMEGKLWKFYNLLEKSISWFWFVRHETLYGPYLNLNTMTQEELSKACESAREFFSISPFNLIKNVSLYLSDSDLTQLSLTCISAHAAVNYDANVTYRFESRYNIPHDLGVPDVTIDGTRKSLYLLSRIFGPATTTTTRLQLEYDAMCEDIYREAVIQRDKMRIELTKEAGPTLNPSTKKSNHTAMNNNGTVKHAPNVMNLTPSSGFDGYISLVPPFQYISKILIDKILSNESKNPNEIVGVLPRRPRWPVYKRNFPPEFRDELQKKYTDLARLVSAPDSPIHPGSFISRYLPNLCFTKGLTPREEDELIAQIIAYLEFRCGDQNTNLTEYYCSEVSKVILLIAAFALKYQRVAHEIAWKFNSLLYKFIWELPSISSLTAVLEIYRRVVQNPSIITLEGEMTIHEYCEKFGSVNKFVKPKHVNKENSKSETNGDIKQSSSAEGDNSKGYFEPHYLWNSGLPTDGHKMPTPLPIMSFGIKDTSHSFWANNCNSGVWRYERTFDNAIDWPEMAQGFMRVLVTPDSRITMYGLDPVFGVFKLIGLAYMNQVGINTEPAEPLKEDQLETFVTDYFLNSVTEKTTHGHDKKLAEMKEMLQGVGFVEYSSTHVNPNLVFASASGVAMRMNLYLHALGMSGPVRFVDSETHEALNVGSNSLEDFLQPEHVSCSGQICMYRAENEKLTIEEFERMVVDSTNSQSGVPEEDLLDEDNLPLSTSTTNQLKNSHANTINTAGLGATAKLNSNTVQQGHKFDKRHFVWRKTPSLSGTVLETLNTLATKTHYLCTANLNHAFVANTMSLIQDPNISRFSLDRYGQALSMPIKYKYTPEDRYELHKATYKACCECLAMGAIKMIQTRAEHAERDLNRWHELNKIIEQAMLDLELADVPLSASLDDVQKSSTLTSKVPLELLKRDYAYWDAESCYMQRQFPKHVLKAFHERTAIIMNWSTLVCLDPCFLEPIFGELFYDALYGRFVVIDDVSNKKAEDKADSFTSIIQQSLKDATSQDRISKTSTLESIWPKAATLAVVSTAVVGIVIASALTIRWLFRKQ